MSELTPKQKAFADNYIECGNATEAARKAGYSEKTARQIGAENLTKPSISQYIAERTTPTEKKRIATGDEVMEFFTVVMRGEIRDAFDLPPSLSDRKDAAKELAKRTWDIDRKNNNGANIAEGMAALAEILMHSKPNRNISDYE